MILNVEDIAKELKEYHEVDLDSYDSKFLLKTIKNRMTSLGITSPGKYLLHFRTVPDEAHILIQEIGINVSSFFRDPYVYSHIEQHTLPSIIETKRKQGLNEIRVWSAGCSTGEEPYSIAILLDQILGKDIKNWKIRIFATDIEQKMLTEAVTATFPREKLNDTKLGIVDQYFIKSHGNYKLKSAIKDMINFSLDDLTSTEKIAPSNSIFGSFDLVLCRNVLIYFNKMAKNHTIRKLSKTLNNSGYLILGESEWVDSSLKLDLIEVHPTNRIYKKNRNC